MHSVTSEHGLRHCLRDTIDRLMPLTVARWRMAIVVGLLAFASPLIAAGDASLDLETYAGKVVVVDFWASWCVPCRRSFPWLNAMNTKYADKGLVIVGVNLDNVADDARAFLDRYPAEFSIVYDVERQLAHKFEVVAMPSSYLIGRDGSLREQHLGFKVKSQPEYEAAIVAALNEEQ